MGIAANLINVAAYTILSRQQADIGLPILYMLPGGDSR